MAVEETNFKIEKLTAENYHSRKFNMKMYLIGNDLWEIVSGIETENDHEGVSERQKFLKRKNRALAAVCLGISTSLQIYVRSAKTAEEA